MKVITSLDSISRLVTVNPAVATRDEIRMLIATKGAIVDGHFALQSGRHSAYLLRFRPLGQDREIVDRIAGMLVQLCAPITTATTVICPESAGFFLGNALAHRLHASVAICRLDERRRPTPILRKGSIVPGTELIVVNDVATSGDSLSTLMSLAETNGATVRTALVFGTLASSVLGQLLNRRGLRGGYLVECIWPTYDPVECPLCLTGGEEVIPTAEFN
jgi:orotate phosphoribosyltransferase